MNRGCKILIVEDEKSIRDVLELNLSLDNFDVLSCSNGADAIKVAEESNVQIIIMDVMMPKMNGIEAIQKIKAKRPEIPIIMLSALNQSTDKIKGLKAGADDYVAKPFNYEELLLRIEKQLDKQRVYRREAKITKIGNNIINITSQTIESEKGVYQMNQKETALILYLINNQNRVISRKEIYANVWKYENFPNSRTVDNHVASLRKALFWDKDRPLIQSVRGIGYKMIID